MIKFYATIFLLLFGLNLLGQTDRQYERYAISESNETISDMDLVDLSILKVERYASIFEANSNFVNLPFIGAVRLNISGEATHLSVLDELVKYGVRTVKLSTPVSLRAPYMNPISTTYALVLSPDDLKTSTLDQLPIRPDSIRVLLNIDIEDREGRTIEVKLEDGSEITVDAFSRVLLIERYIEIKIEPFGWEPVNDIAQMIDWDDSYRLEQELFIDKSKDLPFAIRKINNGQSSIAYLANDRTPSEEMKPSGKPSIKAVPNPAINDLRFEVSNLEPGNYVLKIKNILGELKIEKSIRLSSSEVIPVNIDGLRKGSYFYILENEDGNVLSTKRLIILRP